MRLHVFIRDRSEEILEAFEAFARSHTTAGRSMSVEALRDHAASMLETIALDLQEPQTAAAEGRKSWGDADVDPSSPETPAEMHGTDRAGQGFSIEEMFSEYRALRASVLRLWTAARGELHAVDLADLTRFNQAIDQALAESITRFSAGLDDSREMFLAILGHDLRNPLGAIAVASEFLVTETELSGRELTMAKAIRRSATRMQQLVSDLLDFTRSSLGPGLPIRRTTVDLAEVVRATVEEFWASDGSRDVRFACEGDVTGAWDAERIGQAVSNLIGNACQHGSTDHPVAVSVSGRPHQVVISVRNRGPTISPGDQLHIFDPYRRMAVGAGIPVYGSMGLGLYIAREIAVAHMGWIAVESSDAQGTVFQLHLPRHVPGEPVTPSGELAPGGGSET